MSSIYDFERENTVTAENQVAESIVRSVSGDKPKILFIGNSITLHEVKPEIGWHGAWGMAASEREKDYVHQTMRMAREICPDVGYMIAQAADWERSFWQPEEALERLRAAREYDADIVVIRIGENISREAMAEHDLLLAFEKMIDYFNRSGRAQVIVTDMFWPSPEKSACAAQAAASRGAALVSISDLGTRDDMKAIGLFEHGGVAAHPGDAGMLKIAEAIFEAMKPMLQGGKAI